MRSKLRWYFPFCEKYDRIWAVIFFFKSDIRRKSAVLFGTGKLLCILEEFPPEPRKDIMI
jgi:hypothetical protein